MEHQNLFVRKCQECGHRQVMKDPALIKGDGWKNAKCRSCHSESLDYGSAGWSRDADGSLIRPVEDDDAT